MERAQLDQTADLFQALSSVNRLRILLAIADSEKCVHELTEELDMTHSNISHHLKKLKDTRVVERRKDGKHRYYSMDDGHIRDILDAGVDHTTE